ncbi:DUF6600 domain-containing protein [Algoriphagus litoralis]|uniref:DUF6600 domain-containing protein n=1 Tax=Algoriphagus litoralis TaxID=2202829 RepID=UPI00130032AB|nr:DUF6600 domain-containing protein [Algoriphagus litoralis]
MKTRFNPRLLTLGLSFLILLGFATPSQAESKNYSGISFQVFYDELAPYGDWVKDARYGYIWLPAVRQDFHPYGTEGHWVMTEFGNTWVSYYDWGWAPFHYGRWYFDDYFQSWAWIPGYEWGPAWVSWRTGGGYYGWAPMGPGVSVNIRVNLPAFHWVFLPRHRIYHHYAYRYCPPQRTRVKIYNNTTIINNTYVYNNQTYVAGPSRRELQQVTGRNVPVYQVRNSNSPGRASVSRNSLNVYRPEIQPSRNASVNSRPSRVLEADQAKSSRSNRTLNENAPSRNSSAGSTAPSRTLESSGRSGQNSDVSSGRTTPSRGTSPAINEGTQRPKVTPMPNESRSRSTGPAQTERPETRQSVPSRSTETRPSTSPSSRSSAPVGRPSGEVNRTESRTSAPSRGTVQQSRPSQAPARTQESRTQTPQVRSSAPARSQSPAPTRTQTSRPSPQVKSTAPAARKEAPATPSRGSSTSGRGNSRNN